jgi:SAM-dependent methyltransferase
MRTVNGRLKKEDVLRYDRISAAHWWFVAKRAYVKDVLQRHRARGPLLDFGCGAGQDLVEIRRKIPVVEGYDVDRLSVRLAKKKGLYASSKMPAHPFNTIVSFDVLEHIKDDEGALRTLVEKLRPGGLLILNVPAFAWLWNRHDVRTGHYRRYTKQQIACQLRAAGLTVLESFYWNFLLFIPAVAFKFLNTDSCDIQETALPLNTLLRSLLYAERKMLWALHALSSNKISTPFGTSVMVVAKKEF